MLLLVSFASPFIQKKISPKAQLIINCVVYIIFVLFLIINILDRHFNSAFLIVGVIIVIISPILFYKKYKRLYKAKD